MNTGFSFSRYGDELLLAIERQRSLQQTASVKDLVTVTKGNPSSIRATLCRLRQKALIWKKGTGFYLTGKGKLKIATLLAEQKQCSRCGIFKKIDQFYTRSDRKSGRRSQCISCEIKRCTQNRVKKRNTDQQIINPVSAKRKRVLVGQEKCAFNPYLQELERQAKRDQKKEITEKCFVYYCAWEDRPNAIKIGYTTNVLNRMKSFLTGSPSNLLILAISQVDGPEDEAELHRKFQSSRIRGEWFDIDSSHEFVSHIFALNQSLAISIHQQFPEYYQSCIIVPSMKSYINMVI
jgi:predicted nucleic acid-binding Zn ribbon protein